MRRQKRKEFHYRPKNAKQNPIASQSTWKAPAVFGLFKSEDRYQLLKKLGDLRKIIGVRRRDICLDFSKTEKMYSDGTLLFFSEMHRLIRHVEGKIQINFLPSKNEKVSQVLKQIGFIDLIGAQTQVTPKDDDVVNWRVAHGAQVEGKKYDDILAEYDGDIARPLQEKLFTGITEAMTNVANHAYDLKRIDGLNVSDESKDWWMFSQEKDGYLSVSFCDLGAGIPRTLPSKHPSVWKQILLLNKSNDADIIDHAVRKSVSRTNNAGRGNGLGQIIQVVQAQPEGQVVIYSNRGTFTKINGTKRLFRHSDSILGTLIFWKIPLHNRAQS